MILLNNFFFDPNSQNTKYCFGFLKDIYNVVIDIGYVNDINDNVYLEKVKK